MAAPLQTAWAKARVTLGQPQGSMWEVDNTYPEARLTFGADASAGWPITADNVAPIHGELFWDGHSLWVVGKGEGAELYVDGEPVREWRQIQGKAELRFGQASIEIESSVPGSRQMVAHPEGVRRVNTAHIELPPEEARTGQAVFGGAAGDEEVPDLEAVATRVAGPADIPGLMEPPSGGASGTARHEPAFGDDDDADATFIADRPAALLGQAFNRFDGAPSMKPRIGQAQGAPDIGEPPAYAATAMVAIPPGTKPKKAKSERTVPPPPPGSRRPVVGAPPQTADAQSSPLSVAAAAPAIPPAADSGAAPGGQRAIPTGPFETFKESDGTTGTFVPPPANQTEAPKGLWSKFVGRKKKKSGAKSEGEDSNRALPARTWALLVVTVLSAAGLLLWNADPGAEGLGDSATAVTMGTPSTDDRAADPDPGTTDSEPVTDPGGADPGGADPGGADPGGTDPGGADPGGVDPGGTDPGGVDPHPDTIGTPDPSHTVTAGSEPTEEDPEEVGPTAEARAANLLLTGQQQPALVIYRQLSEQDPENQAYSTMVNILLRATAESCTNGTNTQGQPCE